MIPQEILKRPARILSQAQREHYFEHGFVGVEELLPADLLAELQQVTAGFVDESRKVSESDSRFDIGPGHSSAKPVLRRLKSPDVQSPAYWNFATGLMADVATDLVGPNVVFHHSKLKHLQSCLIRLANIMIEEDIFHQVKHHLQHRTALDYPTRQLRARQINALTGGYLFLSVERQSVKVLAHHGVRQ